MSQDQFKTVYELREIIQRCLKECEDAKYIQEVGYMSESSDGEIKHSGPMKIIINSDQIADHISKTIIGELLEFEVLRKLSPMFRQLRSIEKNMEFLDDKHAKDSAMQSLRIGQK